MKVKNISKGDITANFSAVYAGETFEIPAANFPALVAEYKPEFFKVIDGDLAEQGAEEAPEVSFTVGDVAPAKVGRPKKTV